MAEAITITIDLDSSEVEKGLKDVESQAEKTGEKLSKSFDVGVQSRVDSFTDTLAKSTNIVERFTDTIGEITVSLGSLGLAVFTARQRFFGLTRVLPQIQKALFASNKTLFGTVSGLGLVGAGAFALSKSLEGVENDLLRVVKASSLLVAILAGGLAAGIGFAVVAVGNLAFQVGSNLVSKFQNSVQVFTEAEKSLTVFSKTVQSFNRVTGNGVGNIESYISLLNDLSGELNLTRNSLQRAGSEIVAVGSRLGLNEQQLRELIRVTAVYAKINDKDVFDVSVKLVQALNGQAQSVASLGIKLNETAVATSAYKKGLDRSFASISDNEKVQFRYNKLLEQYRDVAGIASAQAGTLADQQARFEVNTERLNAALGRGAALVENNNLVAASFNLVLNSINENLISAAGFFGALGARLLQVGGIVLKFSFQVVAVVKAIKVLNILLAEQRVQELFGKRILFLNKSLNDLALSFSGVPARITSVRDALFVLGKGLRLQTLQLLSFVSGVNVANLSLRTFAVGALVQARAGLVALGSALAPIITAIAPFAAAIGAIVFVFETLRRAFVAVEERTRAFSTIYNVLIRDFVGSFSILSSVKDFFVGIFDGITTAFNKLVGVVAFGISKLIGLITKLAKTDFLSNFLSDESLFALEELNTELNVFNKNLERADFDIRKLGESTSASLSSISDKFKVTIQDVRNLRNELQNAGKSDIQILEEQLANRLRVLRSAREQELINDRDFFDLKRKIFLDFNDQFVELQKRGLKTQQDANEQQVANLARALNSGVTRLLQSAFERLGASLAQGGKAFNNFGNVVLGIIGDIAIQIGSTLISIGLGIDALKFSLFSLSGAAAIAAGLALVAIGGLLKSLSSGSSAGTPSAASGTQPALEPGPELETDPEEARNNQRVTVNIQGDVFDSEETGSRIAQILQNSFEAEGVDVVRSV